jgi:hypothetical membrane protein
LNSLVVRISGILGIASPPLAALLVLVATAWSPGYDSASRTISRLAEPGRPAAVVVQVAIGLASLSLFALAFALPRDKSASRWALAVAGVACLFAAGIRLDRASVQSTAFHRLATAVVILGLVVAPLALGRAYGVISVVIGAAELVMLAIGAALLTTTFSGWGVWERCLLALPMSWVVVTSARLLRVKRTEPISSLTEDASSWPSKVSAEEKISAAAAIVRSSGS